MTQWSNLTDRLRCQYVGVIMDWLGKIYHKHYRSLDDSAHETTENTDAHWELVEKLVRERLPVVYETFDTHKKEIQLYGIATFIWVVCREIEPGDCLSCGHWRLLNRGNNYQYTGTQIRTALFRIIQTDFRDGWRVPIPGRNNLQDLPEVR